MCIKAVNFFKTFTQWDLVGVPHHFQNQKICDYAVGADLCLLQYGFDCYVKQQEMWYEDFNDDDGLVE